MRGGGEGCLHPPPGPKRASNYAPTMRAGRCGASSTTLHHRPSPPPPLRHPPPPPRQARIEGRGNGPGLCAHRARTMRAHYAALCARYARTMRALCADWLCGTGYARTSEFPTMRALCAACAEWHFCASKSLKMHAGGNESDNCVPTVKNCENSFLLYARPARDATFFYAATKTRSRLYPTTGQIPDY